MKIIYILLVSTLVISCKQNKQTNPVENSAIESKTEITENFDWLKGDWKRLNDKEGKETFEYWTKISPTEFSGIGFTMQKGDTISFEEMQLINSSEKWSLFVKTSDENKPIEFQMTESKNNEFVCTNDSWDFPKQIKYWFEDDKLKANVSNEEMEIYFEFEKIK